MHSGYGVNNYQKFSNLSHFYYLTHTKAGIESGLKKKEPERKYEKVLKFYNNFCCLGDERAILCLVLNFREQDPPKIVLIGTIHLLIKLCKTISVSFYLFEHTHCTMF